MRANERRFIDHALNNTAWAVVIDIGGGTPSNDWPTNLGRGPTLTTPGRTKYPLVLESNDGWKHLWDDYLKYESTHPLWDERLVSVELFYCNCPTQREWTNQLQWLSADSPSEFWIDTWTIIRPLVSIGDMFITNAVGNNVLSTRFANRIERNFLTLYRDIVISALDKYSVPIPKRFLL